MGCYHPIKGSHTSYLYKKGWNGLNLDISAESIEMFKIFRPKDTSLIMGLSDKGGISDAYLNKDISTISSINKDLVNAIGVDKYKILRTIDTTTLGDLRQQNNLRKINFLKIDCEGQDELILSQSTIEDLKSDFLCFEIIPIDISVKNEIMKKIGNIRKFKLIFSAHGLPEKNIKKGDPYQWQVEQSVNKIVESLNIKDLEINN